ncbi:MAG: hypothetical protein ABII82_00275 [Verrucomicrobiota bacterium]
MNDLSADGCEWVAVPPVPVFAWGDWEGAGLALRVGARLELGQPWFSGPEADFQPGTVWLGVCGEDLLVFATLRDDAPANRAVQWNEPTWMTGDVLELFFQAEGRPGYWELHVTPENQRLQLFFPSTAAFHERRGHRHWAVAESRFESLARVNAAGDGWQVMMRVPLALVLDEPREQDGGGGGRGSRGFRFLFSRYDYQPGRARPVTSATARMTAPDFHHIPEWHRAVVAG